MTFREAEALAMEGRVVRRESWKPRVAMTRSPKGELRFTHICGYYWPSLEATKATDWVEVAGTSLAGT
jgi:hypothetical protein